MNIVGISQLCTPAYFYLVVSVVAFVIMFIQNLGNSHVYCVGSYSCSAPSILAIFIFKAVYIIFWTWVLNVICKNGYENISWFLVLIPYVLFFLFIAMGFMSTFDTDRYTNTDYYYRAITG
jgi:hypothetical protein